MTDHHIFSSLNEWLSSPDPIIAIPGRVIIEQWYEGRYQIREFLGGRSNCSVFLAIDVFLERDIALKVWHGRNYEWGSSVLWKEARYLARIEHPSLVRVLNFGVDKRTEAPWMALEFLGRETLRTHLDGEGSFAGQWKVLSKIALEVASAVHYLHDQALIYQLDIKPANFSYNRKNQSVRMMDLGSAMDPDSNNPIQFGSPGYIPPEMFLGRAVTGKSDIFALGVLLFELVTGQNPWLRPQETLLEPLASGSPRADTATREVVPISDRDYPDASTTMIAVRPESQRHAVVDFFQRIDVCEPLVNLATPSGLTDLILSMTALSADERPSISSVRRLLMAPEASLLPNRRISLFISHSHIDKGRFVTRFAQALEQAGFVIWLDQWSLKVGEPFWDRIGQAIQECDFVIVVLSAHSVQSQGVLEELRTAQLQNMSRVKILPIRIDPVEFSTIPLFLRARHVFDFVGHTDGAVFSERVSQLVSQIMDLNK
ncbi:MAG: TIR domain-containing protein [Candidatus Hydrogenedentes bacterium]|nr:TIR domain-containing protein [Candidatus Hydrogenedentota bacterium]